MRVTLENVVEVIEKERKFATLRTFPYSEGKTIFVRLPKARKKGIIETVIENPSKEDLAQFLPLSGFSNVEEWWETALRLHGRRPKFLVVVRVL